MGAEKHTLDPSAPSSISTSPDMPSTLFPSTITSLSPAMSLPLLSGRS